MPKIKYDFDLKMGPDRLRMVQQANEIIEEYQGQGFDLTLRQLYYQFVSRALIANKQSEYKRLGDIVNDGRMCGLIDWTAIVDRTRNLQALSHWDDPAQIVEAVAAQFRIDKWATQPNRVEVWIEKDALVGVIEGVCQEMDVPYFSCRGYTSQSEMWSAAMRLKGYVRDHNQTPVILHFGDHDPSGIDMTRDIRDRLQLFMRGQCEVRRLALNMDQVEEHNPPPNPTKMTDSRSTGYVGLYGHESWELDALDPATLAGLIRGEIRLLLNDTQWAQASREQQRGRDELSKISDKYEDVVSWLEE
jgi:hypothetical protein